MNHLQRLHLAEPAPAQALSQVVPLPPIDGALLNQQLVNALRNH